jgi:hypothetical protein
MDDNTLDPTVQHSSRSDELDRQRRRHHSRSPRPEEWGILMSLTLKIFLASAFRWTSIPRAAGSDPNRSITAMGTYFLRRFLLIPPTLLASPFSSLHHPHRPRRTDGAPQQAALAASDSSRASKDNAASLTEDMKQQIAEVLRLRSADRQRLSHLARVQVAGSGQSACAAG